MKSALQPYDHRFVSFKSISPSYIQEYIGEGRNHLVYRYKNNWVIKIPKMQGSIAYSNSKVLKQDIKLIKRYFPELMVTTKLLSNKDKTDYVILQKFCADSHEIVGEIDDVVRQQLEKIIRQNKKLFKITGHSLDLFGSSGFVTSLLAVCIPGVKPKLSNILLQKKGSGLSLFLVDTELLRLSKLTRTWSSIRFHIRSWISYKLTSFLLRRAFNFASA